MRIRKYLGQGKESLKGILERTLPGADKGPGILPVPTNWMGKYQDSGSTELSIQKGLASLVMNN